MKKLIVLIFVSTTNSFLFSQSVDSVIYEYNAPEIFSVTTSNTTDNEGLPYVKIDTVKITQKYKLVITGNQYHYWYPNKSRPEEICQETGFCHYKNDTVFLFDTVFNKPYTISREFKNIDDKYIIEIKNAYGQPLSGLAVKVDDMMFQSGSDGKVIILNNQLKYSESNIKIFKNVHINDLNLNIKPFNTRDAIKYANYFTVQIFSFSLNGFYVKNRKIVPSGLNQAVLTNFDDQNNTATFTLKK